MTLVPMGLCYLTWFETLRRLPPTSASTGMLLVPVIGVVSAAFILGEPLGFREVAAMVLTLGGVTLGAAKGVTRWFRYLPPKWLLLLRYSGYSIGVTAGRCNPHCLQFGVITYK